MNRAPSPKVKRSAWALLSYVQQAIKSGMDTSTFNCSRPAALHDELKMFLDVHDPDAKYRRHRG